MNELGDRVVWSKRNEEDGDYEIFYHDGTETKQLTNNDLEDYEVLISDSGVVWHERIPSSADYNEIYFFDGSSILPLTNNRANGDFSSGTQIAGDNVYWESSGYDLAGFSPLYDYYTYHFNGDELSILEDTYL